MSMVRCLVIALCITFMSAISLAQDKTSPADIREARKVIQDGQVEWGRARVALDKQTFEKMLAPDFYVLIGGQKRPREEFMNMISQGPPGVKLVRFDATPLTVNPKGDAWEAIIQEKLEYERTADGKTDHAYALWITRDGWKKTGTEWKILYSEEVAHERWMNEKPPIQGW